MHIIVTSHGTFCTGALSVYEMVAGNPDGITAVSLSFDDTGQYAGELSAAVAAHLGEGVLVLCDIVGGTPYNEALRLSLEHPGRVEVLANMNLPMLIEAGMARAGAASLDELYRIAVNAGISSIELASSSAFTSQNDSESSEDEDLF